MHKTISLSPEPWADVEPVWEKADVEIIREKEPEMAPKKDQPQSVTGDHTQAEPHGKSLPDRMRDAARRCVEIMNDRSIVMEWSVTPSGMRLDAAYGIDACIMFLGWIELASLGPLDDDPFTRMEIRAATAMEGLRL